MGRIAKGIRNTLRLMAGLYLLLNLCVATIPRCDTIFAVLQHGLNSEISDAPSCHQPKSSTQSSLQPAHLCECALVKFVFITLPSFNPQEFIAFRVQSSTLILFDDTKALSSRVQGPEPPYPRWSMV